MLFIEPVSVRSHKHPHHAFSGSDAGSMPEESCPVEPLMLIFRSGYKLFQGKRSFGLAVAMT